MRGLYRAAEIDALDKKKCSISIVGSWACADVLWKVGKPATTWDWGWLDEWTAHLAGRHVVLMPERNEFGWSFASDVLTRLRGVAASIRWIILPVEDDGGVLSWFASGGDVQKLTRLVRATEMIANGNEWNETEFARVWATQHPTR